MADDLHHRRLVDELHRLGVTERDIKGLTLRELADLKDRVLRRLMSEEARG